MTDLPCDAGEKADQLKRTAKAHKTDTKVSKAKKEGKVVKRKFKGIRIRKGVHIKVASCTHGVCSDITIACSAAACLSDLPSKSVHCSHHAYMLSWHHMHSCKHATCHIQHDTKVKLQQPAHHYDGQSQTLCSASFAGHQGHRRRLQEEGTEGPQS